MFYYKCLISCFLSQKLFVVYRQLYKLNTSRPTAAELKNIRVKFLKLSKLVFLLLLKIKTNKFFY